VICGHGERIANLQNGGRDEEVGGQLSVLGIPCPNAGSRCKTRRAYLIAQPVILGDDEDAEGKATWIYGEVFKNALAWTSDSEIAGTAFVFAVMELSSLAANRLGKRRYNYASIRTGIVILSSRVHRRSTDERTQ